MGWAVTKMERFGLDGAETRPLAHWRTSVRNHIFGRAVNEWGDVISKLNSLPQVRGGDLFASYCFPLKFS